jgi:cell volume regulation protein A
MSTEAWQIGISVAVLLSYWFLHLGQRLRFPSVVFLLAAGLLLREVTDHKGITAALPEGLLPLLGTIGLILIVLEGALDLDLRKGRRTFLLRTFGSAAGGILLSALAVAAGLKLAFGLTWLNAALMAIPFAVISSAVAIPSAGTLPQQQREFVIYESSWSDILGVMLFNAVLEATLHGGGASTLNFFGGGLMVLLLGGLLGLGFYWFVGRLHEHVKFLPLIFALILVYGTAKLAHLSPLLIVLVLGLMLNNPHLLRRFRWFDGMHSHRYDIELGKLKHLTAEIAFLVRTFFFLLLGYSTDLRTLANWQTWATAISIVAAIFGLRFALLWLVNARQPRPLVWVAPRGLITVLLFYHMPAGVVPAASFPPGTLILVVLLSCVVMALGLMVDRASPAAGAAALDEPPPVNSPEEPGALRARSHG